MATRTRPDGRKFELEIERYCKRKDVCIFPIRLRTPQARQANVNNISDYLLFANKVLILEAKETGANAFSLRDIQQKEELDKFRVFYKEAQEMYGELPYRAVVLVHFIKKRKYTAYFIDSEEYKLIHPDDEGCITADSLAEIMEKLF